MVAMFQVLIVEDDSELREVLRRSLIRLGCQVSIAESSEEGLDKLSSEKYDAVFASLCKSQRGRCVARFGKIRLQHQVFPGNRVEG